MYAKKNNNKIVPSYVRTLNNVHDLKSKQILMPKETLLVYIEIVMIKSLINCNYYQLEPNIHQINLKN